MANVNNPHGFFPLGRTMGGGNGQFSEYAKAVGYGTAIFQFDVVHQVADGSIEPAASGTPGTTRWSGVALNWGAVSTATSHLVCVSPDQIYEAQDDDATGVLAVDLGLLSNLIATAGNATTRISKHQIDASTKDVTATLDLKLHRLFRVPNNAHGPNARIEVTINKHRNNAEVAGV